MRCKSDTILHIKRFIQIIKTRCVCFVKVIQGDNGGEFINELSRTLFNDLGILHQINCTFTPQENGLVERKHPHILEVSFFTFSSFYSYMILRLLCDNDLVHNKCMTYCNFTWRSPYGTLHKITLFESSSYLWVSLFCEGFADKGQVCSPI